MSAARTVMGRQLSLALAGVALAIVCAEPARAQGYFGQNQVQYDRFKWKVFETEHFLIHYYPEERLAAQDAARMAERAYGRLSRILDHQFREKKPIILFTSRSDFGQNNVTGDLGEGTGAVTEGARHRVLIYFTGDYRSFDRVLTHELVHSFQYDIFARGKASNGLQNIANINPPLWFIEGMAEYLSLGPNQPITNAVMRDAAINGNLPTLEEMGQRPDRFNPYAFGEAFWEYVGARWGDAVIGELMSGIASVGLERAIKRELGLSLEDLSDEWREAMQTKHLPQIATLDRARRLAQPILSARRTGGGELFIAPTLSSDGKTIAYIGFGSFLRGEVFPDLWLADARTGKRLKRLVKSTSDPNFEELRLLYSQGAFSEDGRYFAFTAQRKGKDVLYLRDVKKGRTVRRYEMPLEQATGPSFSPDGRRIVFSGNKGGVTDLYVIDVDGKNFRQLTDDKFGDLQPQWSPDGKSVVFASDRGAETDFGILRYSHWMISVYNFDTDSVTVLPGQGGHNINPQWAPDSKSIAFVSDRTGISNLFLYDLAAASHYQLTNLIGSVGAITEFSPAISWAHKADRLAFTYYENGRYTVWGVDNPRLLRRDPYREKVDSAPARLLATATPPVLPVTGVIQPPVLASGQAPAIVSDTANPLRQRSLYRSGSIIRLSEDLPIGVAGADTAVLSVAAILDSSALSLPDTTAFRAYDYKVRFQPEFVARPSIGYTQDTYNRGVSGGTTVVLTDMLGNHRLAFSGQVNGRLSEAQLFAGYVNLGGRFQHSSGVFQTPQFYFAGGGVNQISPTEFEEVQILRRYIYRQVFFTGLYPRNRFTRSEVGARFTNVDRSLIRIRLRTNVATGEQDFDNGTLENEPGINFVSPYVAYVSDNTLFGYTGPILGRRYRFQVEPALGSVRWNEYSADYRRYDAILFNYLTVASRFMSSVAIGRDELFSPKYIANPNFIRGYDRQSTLGQIPCSTPGEQGNACSAAQLFGSRFALANAELRFPLIRRFDLGLLPISLPPVDGLFFYDMGLAWSKNQSVHWSRPDNFDIDTQRVPLSSYGFGLRLNLFNFALLRYDYAIPLDRPAKDRKGFGTFSLGPSF